MKLTEGLRDNQHSVSFRLQRRIWDFLGLLETKSPDADQKGKQMLQQICDDAVDLALLMRKAKDHLYVDMLSTASGRPVSGYDSIIEEEAKEARDSTKKSQTVAYILAGALVKCPKDNPSGEIILEKAQAVVYE